jgi:hypothetical protein
LDDLASGEAIVKLVLLIHPPLKVTISRIHKSAAPGSMFAHDNIQNFLKVSPLSPIDYNHSMLLVFVAGIVGM